MFCVCLVAILFRTYALLNSNVENKYIVMYLLHICFSVNLLRVYGLSVCNFCLKLGICSEDYENSQLR